MKPRVILAAVLLLVVVLGWLIKRDSNKAGPGSCVPHAVSLEVGIHSVEVRRSGDHAQLIVRAVFDQSGTTPVRLEPPLVSLLTAHQTTAPRFMGPMLPDPVLTGAEPQEVMLHYWVPSADLKSPLVLEASGHRYPLVLPSGT